MAFAISLAPEEFQRVNDILFNLPGITVVADDILLFGNRRKDEEASQYQRNFDGKFNTMIETMEQNKPFYEFWPQVQRVRPD